MNAVPDSLQSRVDAIRWYHTIDLGSGVVTRGIDNIKKARGDSTSNISDLQMAPHVEIQRGTKPPPVPLNLKMK